MKPAENQLVPDQDGRVALVQRGPGAVLFRGALGEISVNRFLQDVTRCAAVLPDGEHVVNCCANRYWFTVGFAAALLRGQITLLTSVPSEYALDAMRARYGGLHALGDVARSDIKLPYHVIGPAQDEACNDVAPVAMPHIAAERIAVIAFTSGSTGEPVGTAKSFGELAARSIAAGARFGFTPENAVTVIGTVPPHHMYGFETTVLLPLHAAVASWCDPVFYPADLHGALQSVGSRAVLVTTPLQLRAMLAMPRPAQYPAAVISATAPLDRDLAMEAEQAWNTEVFEIFGATEVGSIASRRTVAEAAWSLYPGISMGDADVPMIHAAAAPARPLNDCVELLAGGRYFELLGRGGDMIKLAGRRASLAGLTRLLNGVDGVTDGVFIAPDDLDSRPNARLIALVVSATLSDAEILEALRARIDPVFLPRPLIRVPSLPRNALGKLPRQALQALLDQHAPPSRRRASV